MYIKTIKSINLIKSVILTEDFQDRNWARDGFTLKQNHLYAFLNMWVSYPSKPNRFGNSRELWMRYFDFVEV